MASTPSTATGVGSTDSRWHLLAAATRTERAWKNGAGTTADVVVFPPGASDTTFAWRVSIATITGSSAFSLFPGVDRWLVPLDAPGLALLIGGHRRQVPDGTAVAFAGEETVNSLDGDHTSKDLNLMVRRGAATGTVRIETVQGVRAVTAAEGSTVVVVVIDGALLLGGQLPVRRHDALFLSGGTSLALFGEARVAIIEVTVT